MYTNGIKYEIQQRNHYKKQNYNIKNEVLSISDYAIKYCLYLKIDLKMISSYYNINGKRYYKLFVAYCYHKQLKQPRIRVNYYNNTLELYEQKRHQAIILKEMKL